MEAEAKKNSANRDSIIGSLTMADLAVGTVEMLQIEDFAIVLHHM